MNLFEKAATAIVLAVLGGLMGLAAQPYEYPEAVPKPETIVYIQHGLVRPDGTCIRREATYTYGAVNLNGSAKNPTVLDTEIPCE